MSFIKALNWRYAVNQFSDSQLSEKQIHGLIESVRLAPSAYGIQPYKLLIVKNPALRTECVASSFGQAKVAQSSHLLVFAHQKRLTSTDIDCFISNLANSQGKSVSDLALYKQQISDDLLSKTENQQAIWAAQQCYIGLGTLLFFAALNNIDACPMTGFDVAGIDRILGLAEQGLSAAILCPIGFRSPKDASAIRSKYRLSQDQLVVRL